MGLLKNKFLLPVYIFPWFCLIVQKQSPGGKDVLKNLWRFTGKRNCLNLILNKVAGRDLQLKKRLWHRCFLVNFGKLLGTHILQNTFGRLFPIVKKVIFLSSPHTNFSNICCNNCVLQFLKITSKVSVYKNNHGFKLLFYLEI